LCRFLQKLLVVALSGLALMAGAGFGLTTFDVVPARADALLLVDVDTGKVISERSSTHPWYPASVTKLMTTYVTLKAVRDHRIGLDSLFTVSPKAVAQNPFKMGFKVGTGVTVDNALKMLLVHSPNDIAVVLAEGVSGSIENFAGEMNAEAQRLGMTQTNYVNPNGLPAEEQVTSARDLAILARALILEFPEYDYYWHIASIRLGNRVYRNTNRLIDAYAGTDGMKTGFTCASGYNLVATASRGGKRLIAVVLGATSSTSRAVKAAQLFQRGFGIDPLDRPVLSQSTMESLEPVAATPPDLREEVCENKRRHRQTKDGEEGGEAATAPAKGANNLGERHPSSSPRGAGVLTAGLAAGIPPVEVYTGPVRNNVTPSDTVAPATKNPAPKKKPVAATAKPTAGVGPSPIRRQHLWHLQEPPDDLRPRMRDAAGLPTWRLRQYLKLRGVRDDASDKMAAVAAVRGLETQNEQDVPGRGVGTGAPGSVIFVNPSSPGPAPVIDVTPEPTHDLVDVAERQLIS
jgi:D-alanyl-D-alanine carboxypeptidase